jgi:hypothetical protein
LHGTDVACMSSPNGSRHVLILEEWTNLSVCSSVGTRQAASLFQLSTRMAPGQEIQRMAKR